jgi:hypothetical protein
MNVCKLTSNFDQLLTNIDMKSEIPVPTISALLALVSNCSPLFRKSGVPSDPHFYFCDSTDEV